MKVKTIVYTVVISLIMTNFYPHLKSDPKVYIYVLGLGTTKYEQLFFKSIRKKTNCCYSCCDTSCCLNPCGCDCLDVDCCTCFGGFKNSKGKGYKLLEKQINLKNEYHEIGLNFIDLREYIDRSRNNNAPLTSLSNIAKPLCIKMAKHTNALFCFITCDDWYGFNTVGLISQMIDENKENISWEYIRLDNPNPTSREKDSLKWPRKAYNFKKIPPIIHVNLEIPGSYENSNPINNVDFSYKTFPDNISEYKNYQIQRRDFIEYTFCRLITKSTTTRTLEAAEEAIDFIIEQAKALVQREPMEDENEYEDDNNNMIDEDNTQEEIEIKEEMELEDL